MVIINCCCSVCQNKLKINFYKTLGKKSSSFCYYCERPTLVFIESEVIINKALKFLDINEYYPCTTIK